MIPLNETPEYEKYKVIEHWHAANEVILVDELAEEDNNLFPLFLYIYKKAKKEYKKFPIRKDGTNPLIHPLNVVWNLKKAKIKDHITLCAGLAHDLIEESVDVYKKENNLTEKGKDIDILDKHEEELFENLEKELNKFCKIKEIDTKNVKELISVVRLLTRHKRDFYYRSISSIFANRNKKNMERALQVKLSDRIHNIQCLNTFTDKGKIYQCFKNFFILNNTKNYFIKKFGKDRDTNKAAHPTEKLFKKCCKATYDAFLSVCNSSLKKRAAEVESMLQLAFRKFAHERGGLWEVTNIKEDEVHPMILYEAIIRKYDNRLHQEYDSFNEMERNEMEFCKRFFSDFKFTNEQLKAIINYKDAYALKEAVSRMLYKRNYLIKGFGCNELCTRGMICMNRTKK